MRNKFRLPFVAVFTYSFQNCGSLHLVQAAASKKPAQIRTVDFSTAFCSRGSWSFTPNLCPVQKIKTKFLVSPFFTVRNYSLTDFHSYLFSGSHLLFGMPFSLMKRFCCCCFLFLFCFCFLNQAECYIAYRMLISCPYQLRTGSSSAFHWPRTQCKMADSTEYSGRKICP